MKNISTSRHIQLPTWVHTTQRAVFRRHSFAAISGFLRGSRTDSDSRDPFNAQGDPPINDSPASRGR